MWPFDRRERGERQWIRRAFSEYLSKELVEQLTANPQSLTMGEMTKVEVQFLLFQVRDGSLGDIRDLMNAAIAVAVDSGGVIDCMMSSMVLVIFGMIAPADGIPEDHQSRAGAALIEKLGRTYACCMAVRSACTAWWGPMRDSPTRCSCPISAPA